MEGRKSLYWACSFLLCAGCITGNNHKLPHSAASPPAPAASAAAPITPTVTEAKKDPKSAPRLVVALGKFKESEAKALDREPEKQFKIRYEARDCYTEAVK